MNQLGLKASISSVYDVYLRPLIKQGCINYNRSVLNGKENLYYPANIETENSLSFSLLPLTEDCRLILNKHLDEKKVLEESFITLLERRSNGGGSKYKIIDIDGYELTLDDLLEKYFFSSKYHTSCSVVLTKSHNNIIEECSIDNPNSWLQEKVSPNALFDNSINVVDIQEEAQKEPFECYYCNNFRSRQKNRI